MKRYISILIEDIQTAEVSKDLMKAGWNKKKIERINFKNITTGDYDISSVTKFGANHILIYPLNKDNIEKMLHDLKKYNPEYKNGYIMINRKM